MPIRLTGGAGLAGCVALVLAGCGGSSTQRNDIVFVSSRDGAYELYAMNGDGSHQHRLTRDGGDASSATRLYYQIEPAWSPNGRLIAFASLRDGPSHIFVVDAGGKRTRRLTSGSRADTHPSWSPDGRRIAFVRGGPGAVEVMNADGTNAHRVTAGSDDEGDPAWSPDGRWIAYDRKIPADVRSEVWLVHPDGSDQHRLTSTGANSISPSWSPDGRQIAFSSDRGGSTLGIYIIRVSERGLRPLTRAAADAIDPAWSRDGKLIAFSRDGAIVTVTLGGKIKRLSDTKNNDSSPAWNPLSRRSAA